MKKELVSIVVPVYNVEKYIEKCIDSILEQSYKDFELILVDDQSSDDSGNICDRYQKLDSRIKVYHKKNGGVSSARNLGIDNSNGYYITFIDSDDYVSKNYISDMIDKFDDNIDMVVSGCNILNDYSNQKIGKKIPPNLYSSESFLKQYLLEKVDGCCWGKMYIKKIVDLVRFDEQMTIGEDLKFIVEYLKHSSNIKTIDKYNYYYYERQNSLIRKKFNNSWLKEIDFCLNQSLNDIKNKKYYIIRKNRTIIDLLWRNNIDKANKRKLKKELINGLATYLFSFGISLKYKLKILLVLFVR